MSYRLPTFNLLANIWHGIIPPVVPTTDPDLNVECNLRYPGRGPSELLFSPDPDDSVHIWQPGMHLLVPMLTDIRDALSGSGVDIVECPAGTGRYYLSQWVDDIGKGFPNEHRIAFLVKFVFPSPIP